MPGANDKEKNRANENHFLQSPKVEGEEAQKKFWKEEEEGETIPEETSHVRKETGVSERSLKKVQLPSAPKLREASAAVNRCDEGAILNMRPAKKYQQLGREGGQVHGI